MKRLRKDVLVKYVKPFIWTMVSFKTTLILKHIITQTVNFTLSKLQKDPIDKIYVIKCECCFQQVCIAISSTITCNFHLHVNCSQLFLKIIYISL